MKKLLVFLFCIPLFSLAQTDPARVDYEYRRIISQDGKSRGLSEVNVINALKEKWDEITQVKGGLKDSIQAIRDTRAVRLKDHGGGPSKTGAQNLAALKKAIARAKLRGIKVVEAEEGNFWLDSFVMQAENDGIELRGAGIDKTFFKLSTGQAGATFDLIQTKGVILHDFTVDGSAGAAPSGGVRVNGDDNLVERVKTQGCKSFSITVSGRYSNGVSWVNSLARNNAVRWCKVTDQWYYHSTGGNGSILAADSAVNTVIEFNTVYDSFKRGETGDYYGNDHAVYTKFRSNVAWNTTGLHPGAALHLEGEQTFENMYVEVESFFAVGFTMGMSISQNTRLRMTGLNHFKNCKYAISAYGNYSPDIEGVVIENCGSGLENSDTEAVVQNAKAGRYRKFHFIATKAKNAFVNYNGNPASSVDEETVLQDWIVDKRVQGSYINVGSYNLTVKNVRFQNTSLEWYGNIGLRLTVQDCHFSNSVAVGARAALVRFQGGTMKSSNSALTAVSLQLDNFNFRIENMHIEGYLTLGDEAKMTIGYGMTQNNMVVQFKTAEQAINERLNAFLLRTGGTMDGNLNIANANGNAGIMPDRVRLNTTLSIQGNPGITGYGFRAPDREYRDSSTPAGSTTAFVSAHGIGIPTFSAINVNQTFTEAANWYISGPPVSGMNVNIANAWALYIAFGKSRMGGDVRVIGTVDASAGNGIIPGSRTTAQRMALTGLKEGQTVYDTDLHKNFTWDGTSWQPNW